MSAEAGSIPGGGGDHGLEEILKPYPVGTLLAVHPCGGTAGKTWRVETDAGVFFLRRRGIRTSSPVRLRFDHGLRDHLVAHGVPTAAALSMQDGRRWRRRPEGVYELYPFVEGCPLDPDSVAQVAAAGRALAQYHMVAATYVSPDPPAPIAQYTTLGFSPATSDRMDDPILLRANLRATGDLAATQADRALVERCIQRVVQMASTYAGSAYVPLTGWVIHGDYTPANVLFSSAGQVAGIFDLDWAVPGARCRDVADGLYFFGSQPRRLDAACIWSLTQATEFDLERCRAFLRAYVREAPLEDSELKAIPAAFTGRWLSIRLEGMAKVTKAERFRFFSREVDKPLRWLDAHWGDLIAP